MMTATRDDNDSDYAGCNADNDSRDGVDDYDDIGDDLNPNCSCWESPL